MPPGSIGRQHIAALVHQFPYHIFFIICICIYLYRCYLYYIIYCYMYMCVDFENKISSWDKVKCVDDTCMWARSIEAAYAWFDLCAHNGITLNPKKFQFAQDTVDFAELSITPTNIQSSTKFLDAMRDFHTPTDISGTRAWFGLVNQGTNTFASTKFTWTDELNELLHKSKEIVIREI